jgi:hypothetical protein
MLAVMAVLILWMGIGSVSFTSRSEASSRQVLELMHRPQPYNAHAIIPGQPIAQVHAPSKVGTLDMGTR